jgi:hypothetical protein
MSVGVTISPLVSAPNRIGKSEAPVNKDWALVNHTRSHLRLTGSAAFNRRIKRGILLGKMIAVKSLFLIYEAQL